MEVGLEGWTRRTREHEGPQSEITLLMGLDVRMGDS